MSPFEILVTSGIAELLLMFYITSEYYFARILDQIEPIQGSNLISKSLNGKLFSWRHYVGPPADRASDAVLADHVTGAGSVSHTWPDQRKKNTISMGQVLIPTQT